MENHLSPPGDHRRYSPSGYQIKYRIRTLIVFTALIAVLLAAITSDRRAWHQCKELDAEIEDALGSIDADVAEHFKIDEDRQGFPPLSSYAFAGNGSGSARGGIIEGPRTIERQIVVANDVNVTIEIRSDWYFFAGKPYVRVDTDGSKGSLWFVEMLNMELENAGATARIGE